MSSTMHGIILMLIIAGVTMLLRALPFLLFPEGRSIPKLVAELSNMLPCAVMGMLIVYCLRKVSVFAWPFGLPELIAIGIVVGCHIWKRMTLLSILAGTISYMFLIQVIF